MLSYLPTIRVLPETRQLFEELADKEDQTLSEYLRVLLLDSLRRGCAGDVCV
jgi:hypothetical protein